MKLVFAIKSLNVQGGGAERVLVDVANGLSERGHAITVLTFDGSGRSFYPLSSAVARVDLSVGPPGLPTPRFRLLAALPRMRRVIRELAPDLAMGFMHSMYVPLGVALFKSGVPVIASEHTGFDHFRKRPMQRGMVAVIDSLFVAKTIPSEALRMEHPGELRGKVFALANPLALAAFDGIHMQPPEHPPAILSVGRFMEEKNHIELIQAFDLIAQDYPDWRLRIVGDGVMRGQLEEEIDKRGLAGRVELPGATRDIASEYSRATIVAVPSLYESFGMVTAEALASGRPVVGFSDCTGTRDLIVDRENGLLIDGGPGRVRNFAAGLRTLMDDTELRRRLGASGPDSVQRFASGSVLETWEKFLHDCASRNARN